MISLESLCSYLFSVIDDKNIVGGRDQHAWERCLSLAGNLRMPLVIGGLICERPDLDIPLAVREKISADLIANKARNALLSLQIQSIAKSFGDAYIPCMFIKGGACLVRNLYPAGWRFMSDIDILVKREDIERASRILYESGYDQVTDGIEQLHHLPPFSHPGLPGEIELHWIPYPIGAPDKELLEQFWSRAECVSFMGTSALVPELTDHVWLMLRTDLVSRATIPRLSDIFEYSLIIDRGLPVDRLLLEKRADADRIPGLINSFFTCVETFADGYKPVDPQNCELCLWEGISRFINRNELSSKFWQSSRRRILAVRFLSRKGIMAKTAFALWLAKEIVTIDRFQPGDFKKKPLYLKAYEYSKLLLLFAVSGIEHFILAIHCKRNNRH